MLFDLSKCNVRVFAQFPNEVVLKVITRNLMDENPVKVYGEEGTLDGTFSDVTHPKAPPTAQVCLYRLSQEPKKYSFVGWDPDEDVLNGYGVVVEIRSDGLTHIAIVSEDDMDMDAADDNSDSDERHEDVLDNLSNYNEGEAHLYASILVDFP